MPDFTVKNEGSLVLLEPFSDQARDWVDEHISENAQWYFGAVVVEHRYIEPIIEGIQEDGMTVEVT